MLIECKACGFKKQPTDFYHRSGGERIDRSACKKCWNFRSTTYRLANKDAINAKHREWNKNNPGKKASASRQSALKQKYGLLPGQYDVMLNSQNGRCAICNSEPTEKRPLCVDHCHHEGHVRKLLCDRCNRGLGAFRDDPRLIKSALDYLRRKSSPRSSKQKQSVPTNDLP